MSDFTIFLGTNGLLFLDSISNHLESLFYLQKDKK